MNNRNKEKKRNSKLKWLCAWCLVIISIAVGIKGLNCQRTIHENIKQEIYINSNDGNQETNISDEDLSEWNLMLVNPWNEIPRNFSVELTQLGNGHAIDKRVYHDLQYMMNAMRSVGLSPLICSSYRTNEKQQTLFNNEVNEYLAQGYSQEAAKFEAGKWVAAPGTSEHQTGLAVDIVDTNYQMLDRNQENTAVQKWLMDNSYKYGFILRYPNGKSEITGIYYEPWHYRYVGKDAAKEIYEKGICLEEYLNSIK